jgi:S-DNA-T family DNA segregation ATPase FtsK/SpoIIIE
MDEFADMIGECKEIEEKVTKLAAKARAAGIHLVLATQRPSVDVLSGTAKNNFPARIAFALSSQQDSRTILNFAGAENLLGRGDMLYLAPGSNEGTKRIQGCYVSDEEVRTVVDYVINNNEPDFDESVEAEINKRVDATNNIGVGVAMVGESIESDEEMMAYAKVILKEFIRLGRASSSYIQRQLRVGFGKAARILDWLARKKFISESDGTSKARSVFITKEQYVQIFGETDFDDHD